MTIWNLDSRSRQSELMDQPGLDEYAHRQALAGISRINRICGIGRVLWREIDRVVAEERLTTVRILDIACGGGDLPVYLARRAATRSAHFHVDACDISPTAIAHAEAQADSARVANVRFFQRDALNGSLREAGEHAYDVITCTSFLHHLAEDQAVRLLRSMAALSQYALIVDDVRRTSLGYSLAWLGTRLFTRSPMNRVDGPLSVRNAFTVGEVCGLAEEAGLRNIRVVKHWPQRLMMTWRASCHEHH